MGIAVDREGATAKLMTAWRVLGCRGCGSAIVEAALVLAGIPYEREEVDYDEPEAGARPAARSSTRSRRCRRCHARRRA